MHSLSVRRRSTRPLRTCMHKQGAGIAPIENTDGPPQRPLKQASCRRGYQWIAHALCPDTLLACWPALKSGAMLLVDLWIVVMTLSGSERSTARTAQLTGKNPTEPKPGESGAQRRSQSSRAVLSTRMSNIAVSQSLLQTNSQLPRRHSACRPSG
jgi:hypothetical protein